MTLKEIINKTKFNEVWDYLAIETFKGRYTEQEMLTYRAFFEELKTMDPIYSKENIKIYLEYFCEDDVAGWIVDGIKEDDMYALDFTPWNEWLGMEIHSKALNSLKTYEIAAHCLWEMSFYGFNENQVEAIFDELKETQEAVKQLDTGMYLFDIQTGKTYSYPNCLFNVEWEEICSSTKEGEEKLLYIIIDGKRIRFKYRP